MVNILLQVICSFLFAVGFLFILLELRTHFDRSFLFFGVSLVLLCVMTAIDIWPLQAQVGLIERLFWERTYHGIACIFIPFSLWYLCLITGSPVLKAVPTLILASSLMAAAFMAGLMINVKDGAASTTIAYNILFLPYVAFYIFAAHYVILRRINKAPAPEKRILRIHLCGFAILILCGLTDIAVLSGMIPRILPSFTLLGVMAFGVMATLIFAERFLLLLKDRQTNFEKLESAYRDLEQVSALKQIGESTAIINHEIKNYMFMISGNAQILEEMEQLSQKGKDIVKNIVSSVERLTVFSDDILKLSRTHVIREKHPINLTELIKGAIDKHYPTRRASFTLVGMERDHFLFGDWGKMEQVFVNMFNNSFDAGQGAPVEIRVRITDAQSLLLVSVEDDGSGCTKEQLDSIFTAFYTTKKSQGGTGLGMSITRTIVESHGGKISAYSKNLVRKGEHGLKLIMTFPLYAQNMAEEAQRKHPIVLIKEGMENLPDIIRVFQNVRVSPRVIQTAAELEEVDFPQEAVTVLVSAKTMASSFAVLSGYPRLCLVSHHQGNLYVLDHGRGNRPEIFSEEYVVARLVHRTLPRVRHRERQANLAA